MQNEDIPTTEGGQTDGLVSVPSIGKQRPQRPVDAQVDTSRLPSWKDTQKLLFEAEKAFNSRIIMVYIPLSSSLTELEVTEIYNHLSLIGAREKLALLIYGPGGSGMAAYRIVKLVREFTQQFEVIVPDKAASAMTMLSLGANCIYGSALSYFTPIDTSIANHALAPRDAQDRPITVEITQVQKYLELVATARFSGADDFRKTPEFALSEKLHPVFLGTLQRSLTMSRELTRSIVSTHMSDAKKIGELISELNDSYPSHSYPILMDDMKRFGLNLVNMTPEQNMLARELIELAHVISKRYEKIDGAKRTTRRIQGVIESLELRSYYLDTTTETLVDKTWVRESSSAQYEHALVARNKRGYYEAIPVAISQFRQWMSGAEVESAT
jgi:hypothetical protein